jgi:hypothetical protein
VRVYATRFTETTETTERQIYDGRVGPLLERKRVKKELIKKKERKREGKMLKKNKSKEKKPNAEKKKKKKKKKCAKHQTKRYSTFFSCPKLEFKK